MTVTYDENYPTLPNFTELEYTLALLTLDDKELGANISILEDTILKLMGQLYDNLQNKTNKKPLKMAFIYELFKIINNIIYNYIS